MDQETRSEKATRAIKDTDENGSLEESKAFVKELHNKEKVGDPAKSQAKTDAHQEAAREAQQLLSIKTLWARRMREEKKTMESKSIKSSAWRGWIPLSGNNQGKKSNNDQS
jgi:hypothetical protein